MEPQAITNPFGITVFGSSVVHVEPDVVVLNIGVEGRDPEAKIAFQQVRIKAQAVSEYLSGIHSCEFKTSFIQLSK